MPYRVAALRNRRHHEVAHAAKRLTVERRHGAPLVVPEIQVRKLQTERNRLDRVQPCRVADHPMHVLLGLPVLAERPDRRVDRGIVRDERAGVAERAEILAGVEAERRGGAAGTRPQSVTGRAVRLAGVLEDRQAAPARKLL
jgi:hypothetical protein